MPTRISHPLAVTFVVGGVAVFAAACSSSGSSIVSATASPTSPAAVSASASASGPAAEALLAYRVMWADVVAANATSNYQASELADHLGGQALLALTTNMAAEKEQGVITLGKPTLHPVVVSASSTSVEIQDCVDETNWLEHFAAPPQKLVNDIPGGDRATTATVTNENGVWKVTAMDSGSDGSCHVSP